jgi:hypothetical protein
MSDVMLERLRSLYFDDVAERIEKLKDENDILKQMWWDAGDVTDLAGAIVDLESKLAKAISAFEQIEAGVVPETDPDTGIWIECNMSEDEMQEIARTTLAELRKD